MIHVNNQHLHRVCDYKLTPLLKAAVDKFVDTHAHMPMFSLRENLEKTLVHQSLAEKARQRFTDIVLLGTGGSSLGAQLLCKFSKLEDDIRIHFFDNIDPLTFKHFWEKNRLETTLFLIISKSGTTPETLTQALISVARAEQALGVDKISDHFVVVTEPKPSPLKKLADRYGFLCIDHDQGIGGRFSGLSLVGLLPAMLMGVSIDRVISGAQAAFDSFLAQPEDHPFTESVGLIHQIATERNLNQTVLMTYVDQLEPLGRWFRQLWAESLGKDGKGTTPINAMGAVDQHSQLQLYLDGPKDKIFTVITHPLNWAGDSILSEVASSIGFEYMVDQTMGSLMQAEQVATIQVLQENGCPTRIIDLSEVSAEVVGELMIQFVIETILMSEVMGVDCFNQPAVERGKILTRQLLERAAAN